MTGACFPAWVTVSCFTMYNCHCSFELVENVPYDLAFEINSTAAKPLYQAWMRLLDIAQEKIHVASYYWSLTGKDINVNDSSSKQVGENQWQAPLWLYVSYMWQMADCLCGLSPRDIAWLFLQTQKGFLCWSETAHQLSSSSQARLHLGMSLNISMLCFKSNTEVSLKPTLAYPADGQPVVGAASGMAEEPTGSHVHKWTCQFPLDSWKSQEAKSAGLLTASESASPLCTDTASTFARFAGVPEPCRWTAA